MKSPADLRKRLVAQWENPVLREKRLLSSGAWPIELSIAKPSPKIITHDISALRSHLSVWRSENVGTIKWSRVSYRSLSEPIDIPTVWRIDSPTEWVYACENSRISHEFNTLEKIVKNSPPLFHKTIVRQRNKILAHSPEEIISMLKVAMELEKGCAKGKPLRAISIHGCDTKFIERNQSLITTFLTLRFGDEVRDLGLCNFLEAEEDSHWLLVAPLYPDILPFNQIRLRSSEIKSSPLPANNILIVENERSLHQIPALKDTIAVLGAGLNLGWMQAEWLNTRKIVYWGDIDTWGFQILSMARSFQPSLSPVMMNKETYSMHIELAVEESVRFSKEPPANLTAEESELYVSLFEANKRNRLEQEFISQTYVEANLKAIIYNP